MVESEKTFKEFESLSASSNPSLLQFYNQNVHQNEDKLDPEGWKVYKVRVSSCLQFVKAVGPKLVGTCLMLQISVANFSGPFAGIMHCVAWSRCES